ncbi:hypothetical protein HQ587_10020 [bacterium]|nr:hypothetical protein [bacterium]
MLREQKRALYGLLIFGGILLAAILLFSFNDPSKIFENKSAEIIYVGLLVGGFSLYGIMILLTRKRREGEEVTFDERDIHVARHALQNQVVAVIVTVTIWCGALTEIYIEENGVPVPLMLIMVNSVYFVNMLVRSISILRGYNMSNEKLTRSL